jgi:holo-[acyl-carrier protein] synthase
MIIGIGIDLVDLKRIEAILERNGERFISKVFTGREIRTNEAKEIGGKFAAKEAFVKAIGTGFDNIRFKDIEVLNTDSGKPYYCISGRLAESMNNVSWQAHLSITNERGLVAAVAVLEKL